MQRITDYFYCSLIEAGLKSYPPQLRKIIRFDVFCGDPIYAGLHCFEEMSFERSYRNTVHVAHPYHTTDKICTLVLPGKDKYDDQLWVMVHELAHVLDWALGLQFRPVLAVTPYADTTPGERFAEWVTAMLVPGYPTAMGYNSLALPQQDKYMMAVWQRILRGDFSEVPS
jgi:hypothetical protein